VRCGVVIPFEKCGGDADLAVLDRLVATSWPPVRGQDLDISAEGTAKEQIKAGDYQVVVHLDSFQIFSKQGQLSELTKLPVSQGPVNLQTKFEVPGLLPPGKYNMHMECNNEEKHRIMCLEINFQMS